MAAPKGILALLASKPKGSDDSLPGESSGPDSPSGLDPKAEALKSMFSAMKSGDFDTAAMHFQEAYEACHDGGMEEEMDPLAEDDDEMEM